MQLNFNNPPRSSPPIHWINLSKVDHSSNYARVTFNACKNVTICPEGEVKDLLKTML